MFAVLEIITPVFFVVLTGYFVARWQQTPMDVIGKLNIEVFVPALLIFVLSEKVPALVDVQSLAMIAAVVILGSGLVIWPLTILLKWDNRLVLPPVMFNNSGNLGLPLIVLAFGEKALPWAVAFFVVQVMLQFTVGILILERRFNLLILLKNSIFMSAIVGLLMYFFDVHVPAMILPGVEMMSQVSIPLMLIILGGHLANAGFSEWKFGFFVGLLTPLSGFIAALFALSIFTVTPQQQGAVLLFSALPPAVINALLAQKYGLDTARSASIVIMGNFMAVLVLSLVLYIVLPVASIN